MRHFILGLISIVFFSSNISFAGFQELSTYPDNVSPYWAKNTQGITQDNEYWYITNSFTITKHPLYMPLEWLRTMPAQPSMARWIHPSLISQGYNHYGDIDIYKDHVYIPVEGKHPYKVIRLYRSTLEFAGVAELPSSLRSAPWLAINKDTGILYTSDFGLSPRSKIVGFKIVETATGFRLDKVEEFHLTTASGSYPIYLQRIQGAAFNETNRWIVFSCDFAGGGLYFFDWRTKRLIEHQPIRYTPGFPNYEELEGVTVSAYASRVAPYIDGNVHLLFLDNDLNDYDDISLLNFHFNP